MLPACWALLTRVAFPVSDTPHEGSARAVQEAHAALGPVSRAEKRVAAVIALVALFWVFGPLVFAILSLPYLSDTAVALIGALAVFALPSGMGDGKRLLDWEWARRAPFEVLLLVGGGLSLAHAIDESGLASWLAGGLGALSGAPVLLLVLATAALIVLLTELTSNTATAAAFLPLIAAAAAVAGIDPIVLAAPVALAASCAFMLPVATPPNAIIYASGHVTIAQMIRAGVLLNLIGIALITLLSWLLAPLVF
jgi:sodium-dependent dicarboxylate transporter 2/3/5